MSYSRTDVEQILKLISSNDLSTLKAEDFDQFQYQGFDPIKLAGALLVIKKAKSLSDSDFSKDIFKMVAIGMIKGSVTDSNIGKMSEEGKKDIMTLNTTYGIKMGGGKGQNSTTITYPRVMATFPDIAVRMTSIIGGKEFHGGPLLTTRLPSYMQVQVFPSIIPRDFPDAPKKMLLTASLCYSIDQSVQISQLKGPDLKQLASSQSNFTMVGHNSPVPTAEVRKKIFSDLSLEKHYGAIVSVLNDYKAKVDNNFEILDKESFIKEIIALI